jgi:hypothetical protein
MRYNAAAPPCLNTSLPLAKLLDGPAQGVKLPVMTDRFPGNATSILANLLVYPVGDTLTQCDRFGIPSTSHWTGAAIIVQSPRTKTCIVTRLRTSTKQMPSSLAG